MTSRLGCNDIIPRQVTAGQARLFYAVKQFLRAQGYECATEVEAIKALKALQD